MCPGKVEGEAAHAGQCRFCPSSPLALIEPWLHQDDETVVFLDVLVTPVAPEGWPGVGVDLDGRARNGAIVRGFVVDHRAISS